MSFQLSRFIKNIAELLTGGRAHTPRRRWQAARVQPTLEWLERRISPAVCTWIAGNGGNWHTPANWEGGAKGMPSDFGTDIVKIDNIPGAGIDITLDKPPG